MSGVLYGLDPAVLREVMGWCWVLLVVALALVSIGVGGIMGAHGRRQPTPPPRDDRPVSYTRGLVKVGGDR